MIKGLNFSLGATNTSKPAFDSFNKSLIQVRRNQQAVNTSSHSMMRGMSANRRVIQQVGMQVSDFSVQIAGGQSAILAFTQNVPQVVQMFGAWGGVLAGVITILGTLTLVLVKSGMGFDAVAEHLGVARTDFEFLRAIVVGVKDAFFDLINMLVNNFGAAVAAAGVAVGIFTGKYLATMIGSMIAAHGVTGSLIVVINALSATFVRLAAITGIGAVIIAIGVLIDGFLRMKKVLGDWGAVFTLVGESLAFMFVHQLPRMMMNLVHSVDSALYNISASFVTLGANILQSISFIVNPVLQTFAGLAAGIIAAMRMLPSTIKSMMITMANAVIAAIEGMLNKVVHGLNMFTRTVNKLLPSDALLPTIEGVALNRMVDSYKEAGKSIGVAFSDAALAAYSVDFVGPMVESMRNSAAGMSGVSEMLSDMITAPVENTAWKEIKSILGSTSNDFEIRDLFGNSKDDVETESGSKGLDALNKSLTRQIELIRKNHQTMIDGIVKTTKDTLNDSLKMMTDRIESYNRALDVVKTEVTNVMDTFTGALKRGARLWDAFKEAGLTAINSILKRIMDSQLERVLGNIFKPNNSGGPTNLLSSIAGFFGGSKTRSTPSGVTSSLSNFFGGFRANGGPVTAGMGYVVGERRPEMFVPRSSGTIIPYVPGAGSGNKPVKIELVIAEDREALTRVVDSRVIQGVGASVQLSRAQAQNEGRKASLYRRG